VLQSAWEELTRNVLDEFHLNGYSADKVKLQPDRGYQSGRRGVRVVVREPDLSLKPPLKPES
jgi:acetone carboxylase beta subunit